MIRCREVWVRFSVSGHQTVRISRDETTQCALLEINHVGVELHVDYKNSAGQTLKKIVYNFAHVLDYACEGVAN